MVTGDNWCSYCMLIIGVSVWWLELSRNGSNRAV